MNNTERERQKERKRVCVCMMSSAALLLCVQLAPVLQNTLGHEQGPAVLEPGLLKDEVDSILGDVSKRP